MSSKPPICSGRILGGIILPPDSKHAPTGTRETSDYSNRSRPWQVRFHILESAVTMEYIERIYYVRAADPYVAATTAAMLWRRWEKFEAGRGHEQFPETAGPAVAECIDEQDYMQAVKESKKWPRIMQGHKDNPAAFTYFTDEAFVRVWFPEGYFTPPESEPIRI